jgi:putative transposase
MGIKLAAPDPKLADPLIPSLILDPFDPRQEAYRELFRYQIDPELVDQIRSATNGGFVLGSENFQQKIAQMIGQRTWRGSPSRPVKSEEGEGQQEFEL